MPSEGGAKNVSGGDLAGVATVATVATVAVLVVVVAKVIVLAEVCG